MSKIKFLTKKHLPEQKSGITIQEILRSNLRVPQNRRGYNNIHASDLTKPDYCPRKVVLWREAGGPTSVEMLPAELAMTFKMGNITADLITNDLGGDAVWGDWRCSMCKRVVTACRKPETCGCHPDAWWKYKEVVFKHVETGASGSIDALFDLATGKFTVTELKIVAPDEFAKLKMPLWEHTVRTQLYMEIIKNSDYPLKDVIDTENAKVFYTCRSHGKRVDGRLTPFIEFDVKASPENAEKYLNKARQIKLHEDTGEMPAPTCDSLDCNTAQKCAFLTRCTELGGFAL